MIFSTDSQTMITFQTTNCDLKGEKGRFCHPVLTSLFMRERVQCSTLVFCLSKLTPLRPSLPLWNCSCTGKILSSSTAHSDPWMLCSGPLCASSFSSSHFPLQFSTRSWPHSSLLGCTLSTTRSTFSSWWWSPISWLYVSTHGSSPRPRRWRPFSVVLGCRPCCSAPSRLCQSTWWHILWSGASVQCLQWPSHWIWVFSSTSGLRWLKIQACCWRFSYHQHLTNPNRSAEAFWGCWREGNPSPRVRIPVEAHWWIRWIRWIVRWLVGNLDGSPSPGTDSRNPSPLSWMKCWRVSFGEFESLRLSSQIIPRWSWESHHWTNSFLILRLASICGPFFVLKVISINVSK